MCSICHTVARLLRRWRERDQELCRPCKQIQSKNVIVSAQRTELLCAARPVQMAKPESTELCVERQPIKHLQPIIGHPSVMIGCNPQRFLEVLGTLLGTVDTESCLQNPQYVPLRDALMILSPLSLPQISGRHQKHGERQKQNTHTFENNGILGTPQVSERLQDLADHNIYRFRFIGENIELVGVSKIFRRINFDSVPICLR